MNNLLVISHGFPQKDRLNCICVKRFTDLISSEFDKCYIIAPQPYFPNFLKKIKIFHNFSKYSNFSNYSYNNIEVFYPTYFTLPLPFFRNRNWKYELKCVLKVIKQHNIFFNIIHIHFAYKYLI